MKKELYLETSVWNQLGQTERLDWQEIAERFFKTVERDLYTIFISDVVLEEINNTPDEERRNELLSYIEKYHPGVLPLTDEVVELSKRYLSAGFLKSKKSRVELDARHVAISTINKIKHILSFNFEHLVKESKIDGFNLVNMQYNYNLILDIKTPHSFIELED